MLKFYYKSEFEEENYIVDLEWEGEEPDIYDIIQKFKYFLLAKSYPSKMVNRIQYLEDDQLAKLHLLGEKIDES